MTAEADDAVAVSGKAIALFEMITIWFATGTRIKTGWNLQRGGGVRRERRESGAALDPQSEPLAQRHRYAEGYRWSSECIERPE